MRRLVLGSLFAVILCIGLLAPQAGASELNLGMAPTKASIAALGHTTPMATIDWLAWLKYKIIKYLGNGYHPPNGSVPIPGTLLLFGAGFAGLVIRRAMHQRS